MPSFRRCPFSTLRFPQHSVESSLPKSYIGEFFWHGDSTMQIVEINITARSHQENGRLEVVGCGRYSVPAFGRVTDIKVRMVIDEASLDVEIWESEPVGETFFTTDGSHKGKLVDNLQGIEAEWTTRASGLKGNLRLRAGNSITCAPLVASVR